MAFDVEDAIAVAAEHVVPVVALGLAVRACEGAVAEAQVPLVHQGITVGPRKNKFINLNQNFQAPSSFSTRNDIHAMKTVC